MTDKTSQFDAALDEYFSGLALDEKGGQRRACRFSGPDARASCKAGAPVSEKFYIRPEDIEFYKKIRVPLPTLSPLERSRRRMAFAPGYTFFLVQSAAGEKPLISVYPPNTPFKIYEHTLWFSDGWDPVAFAKTFDASRTFFDQFRELQLQVPRPNLLTDSSNFNSEYTNNSVHLKNSYMTFDSLNGENLYYCDACSGSKDCVDCWNAEQCDSCYKCWGGQLYACVYCVRSYQCIESFFLYDCTNCEHCFMSANLRNKKYCFYNEQMTKEAYEEKLRSINLGDHRVFQKYLADFEALQQNAVRKNTYNERAINSTGDWLVNSRDCFQVLFAIDSQRVCYSQGVMNYRDSYDALFGLGGEQCYEFLATSMGENNFSVKFSSLINNSRDLEYCDLCWNCHDCFGCVGLQNKSFCIFNRPYAEEEYWPKVDAIKTAMLAHGEYGEFFPPRLSSFPYNASLATSYQGYDDLEEARRYGYRIEEIPEAIQTTGDARILLSSALPPDIKDMDDSITDKVIMDEANNKKFRITAYELAFYRKHNLPLPRAHPWVRMNQWRKDFDLRLRFFERPCGRCGNMMETSYAPERQEQNIYCEKCYLQEVAA